MNRPDHIAQSVECRATNPKIVGSNPTVVGLSCDSSSNINISDQLPKLAHFYCCKCSFANSTYMRHALNDGLIVNS